MKKRNIHSYILYVSVSFFVVVALLVGFNLYHTAVSSTITPDLELQIQPVNPTFDTNVIQVLKERNRISPVYELDTSSGEADITPQPTPILPQQSPPSSSAPSIPPSASAAGKLTPGNPLEKIGQ